MNEKQAERELFDLIAKATVEHECHLTRSALWDREGAVKQAEHEGWMRGFKERGEMADRFNKVHEPMLLLLGFSLGFVLALLLFVR